MVKNFFGIFFTVFILATQLVLAQDEQTQFLRGFLAGQYTIIGRWCGSDSTYLGTVTVFEATKGSAGSPAATDRSSIRIRRTVNGQTVEAIGRIETATADKVKVLRIRFKQQGQQYEGTFLIGSDLDNYARLSGYIYPPHGTTRQPGLEAWFIKPGPNR